MFLISPTEPPQIQKLGQISSVPERLGVDILWSGREGLCGAQRKTIPDLIASVRDTRLGKELEQMGRLHFRGLIIEGKPNFSLDGELLSERRWTIKQHRGVLMSAQLKGVVVLTSTSHLDTIGVVEQMHDWSMRDVGASSMLYRGNGQGDGWGQLSDRATAIHFLSGLPGVGVELAGRLFDHFGRVPIEWSVTKEELMEVKGIGKKKVEVLLKALA